MRKIRLSLFILMFCLALTSANASEAIESDPKERIEQIENRVHEIWKMDFSEMDDVEKAALKSELKAMKKEVKGVELDKKLSISIGAIIIILLLIIIIA